MTHLTSSELARRRQATRRNRRRRRVAISLALVAGIAAGVAAVTLAASAPSRHGRHATRPIVAGVAPMIPPRVHEAPVRHLRPLRIGPLRPGIAHVYLHGPPRREVALSFDDGFCGECVARIIHTLARTGAHATIFPNGTYGPATWDRVAPTIRRLVALGQLTVGNHTFLHHDAVEESGPAFASDLANNERWIERTFHISARPFFRPPYGAYDSQTLAIAGQLGYTKVIMWSGTLADSTPHTIAYILAAIRYWAKPGAIILMHANYPPTSVALPQILAILHQRGLRPVTLSELLGT